MRETHIYYTYADPDGSAPACLFTTREKAEESAKAWMNGGATPARMEQAVFEVRLVPVAYLTKPTGITITPIPEDAGDAA